MATTDSAPAPEPAATKVVKKSAAAAKKPKSLPSHPPFLSMITEAIATLKERNGSSQYAITKLIEEKHKKLPSNFRKMLLNRLRNLVASGKLVKVKASFKISTASRAAPAPATKKAAAVAKPKAKAVTKPKSKKAPSSKPKPKSVAAATKPKAKAEKVAAKPKAAGKRKAADEKPKPVKVAKTAAKSTPGKKKKKVVVKPKKAAAKKPKSVKSPARKKAAAAAAAAAKK